MAEDQALPNEVLDDPAPATTAEAPMTAAILLGGAAKFEVIADWDRSIGQGQIVSVMVHNDSPSKIAFEWLDWNGDSILYNVVGAESPGLSHAQTSEDLEVDSFFEVDTYSEHPWRLIDTATKREVSRVRFKQSCAVHASEILSATPRPTVWSWCSGLRITQNVCRDQQQLPFCFAFHPRLGAGSLARCIDEHILELIVKSRFVMDVACGRGPTSMQALRRGVALACDKRHVYISDSLGDKVLKVRRSDSRLMWSQVCLCPLGIAYDIVQDTLYVVSRRDNCVQVLHASDGSPVERFYTGAAGAVPLVGGQGHGRLLSDLCQPTGLALHGGLLYVADTGRSRVVVFRTSDCALLHSIAIHGGVRGVAVKPDGSALIVTQPARQTVVVVKLRKPPYLTAGSHWRQHWEGNVLCLLGHVCSATCTSMLRTQTLESRGTQSPRPDTRDAQSPRPDSRSEVPQSEVSQSEVSQSEVSYSKSSAAQGSGLFENVVEKPMADMLDSVAMAHSVEMPDSVAVNAHEIFVCDVKKGLVQVWGFDGAFLGTLGGAGALAPTALSHAVHTISGRVDAPEFAAARSSESVDVGTGRLGDGDGLAPVQKTSSWVCGVALDPVSGYPLLLHALNCQSPVCPRDLAGGIDEM